jgi:hypothetical protein
MTPKEKEKYRAEVLAIIEGPPSWDEMGRVLQSFGYFCGGIPEVRRIIEDRRLDELFNRVSKQLDSQIAKPSTGDLLAAVKRANRMMLLFDKQEIILAIRSERIEGDTKSIRRA